MMLCTCLLSVMMTQSEYWTVDYLVPPAGESLEVGGIGFMSDGDMVLSTRRGQVWRIDHPHAQDPLDATFTLICEGLHEGLGLAVVKDAIFVVQRGELSELIDLDGDQIIDEVRTVTQNWGMSGNYHEFSFGLPVDRDGNMYVSLNVGFWNPHWWHGKSRAPYRGWVLKISPDGKVMPFAGGFRSPAGLGLLEDGTLIVSDNQGDWMPVCPIYAVEEGNFYGHPASLRWFENQPDVEPSDTQPPDIARAHPILWLPYQWSRSTGNVIQDTTDGPFQGQYLIAELTNGQIIRASFETIDGVRQGACWLMHQRVGSAYHIEYGPDGTLYAGFTNRGWGGLAPGNGIGRIKYNGKVPLEMKTAHLLKDGFEITFTKPLAQAPSVHGYKYDYNWWWEYGSPQQHVEDLQIQDVLLSSDGLTTTVNISNLEAGNCVLLTLDHATSTDGAPLQHTEMSYTINKMPGGKLAHVAKKVEPPIERGERVEGWLYLTWADAFDVWNNDGVIACNAELDITNPTQFITTDGPNALVAKMGNSMHTKFSVASGQIKMTYMLAKDAVAEVQLPNGGIVQLSDDDIDGYLGAGIWHNLNIKFRSNPSVIESVEVNGVRTATDVVVNNRTATPSPLYLRSLKGQFAFGDVRLQHAVDDLDLNVWKLFKYSNRAIQTTNKSKWKITDAETFVIWGEGTLSVPTSLNRIESIRFDAKVEGNGAAIIRIGDLEFDLATVGSRKTGGITGYPIKANLIDQNEWCTVEIMQSDSTTVLLNGVPIVTTTQTPSLHCNEVVFTIQGDAIVHIRQTYMKPSPTTPLTPLFNGKNLDGWINVNGAASTWTVQDDMIVCSGKPTGVMRTSKMYENFVLELEWRHMVEGGNAGLFVWSDPIPAVGVPFTRSVELQILDGEGTDWYTTHGDIFSIWGATMTPDRPHPHGYERCLPSELRSNPSPEWNHYKVTCKDGQIKLAVNGIVVSGASKVTPRKGYICLESEGSEVHFKNVRIQELPPSVPVTSEVANLAEGFVTLYNGVDFTNWQRGDDVTSHWVIQDWALKCNAQSKTLFTCTETEPFELILDYQYNPDSDSAYVVIDGKKVALPPIKDGKWSRYKTKGIHGPIGIGGSNATFCNIYVRTIKN